MVKECPCGNYYLCRCNEFRLIEEACRFCRECESCCNCAEGLTLTNRQTITIWGIQDPQDQYSSFVITQAIIDDVEEYPIFDRTKFLEEYYKLVEIISSEFNCNCAAIDLNRDCNKCIYDFTYRERETSPCSMCLENANHSFFKNEHEEWKKQHPKTKR